MKRIIAPERVLSEGTLQCREIIQLIKDADLMMTVSNSGSYHAQLIREFIVNLPEKITDPYSTDYMEAYVRGNCVKFSQRGINDFLGIAILSSIDPLPSKTELVKEITGGKHLDGWPDKGLSLVSKLSTNYSILHNIGVKNWAPSSHSTGISLTLAQFIHEVGTSVVLDFGQFVFDQVVRHAGSEAIKLLITYSSLLCGLVLKKHPDCGQG